MRTANHGKTPTRAPSSSQKGPSPYVVEDTAFTAAEIMAARERH
jgi:hypothetical protein